MRVHGEGPRNARVFFVAEHPGTYELQTGRPMVGRSSQDFNAALNGYDLPHRDDCYITNLIREALLGKSVTQAEVERDAPALEAELQAIDPQLIVTLGQHATRYFLGDDADMESYHGFAHRAPGRRQLVYVMYHPAAGLHSPELGARHLYDMQRLSLLLKGQLPPAVKDDAGETYIDAAPDDVREMFARRPEKLGIDTEGWTHAPWSVQASDIPGFALVMRSPEAIAEFALQYKVSLEAGHAPLLVFHPALHELPMLESMGVDVPDDGFTDTSLKAHLLGIEPVAAKPLFYRHAGMEQDDYSEITQEAGERLAFEFLYELAAAWPRDFTDKLPPPKAPKRKKGEPKLPKPAPYKVGEMEKALRLVDRMLAKEDGGEGTLRSRWANCRAREVLQDELEVVGDMPEPTLDMVPLDRAIRYAGRDADGTLRIDDPLDAQINALGLRGVLNADIDSIPMLNRMQRVGFGVDLDFFARLSAELQVEWDQWQWALEDTIGQPLNVYSTVAVPEYLFETLGLPIKKYTDGGQGSTNDKVLESFRLDPQTPANARDVIRLIQEVREIRKTKTSFADKIPEHAREGRVHPRFRIVGTGRLAALGLNLLAFPKHSKRGLRIRQGFVAGEGRRLGSRDLSQIEMRWFAIDCGDERMLAQFRSGYDFHLIGAAEKLGKRPEDVTKHERFMQKAVNFGILMGITEHGLLDQYHKAGLFSYGLDDLRRYLADWFRQYPAAGPYISEKHAEARRHGYVRDSWGRLRYVPGIRSVDKYVRQEAERQAQATPTQSGASGFMRRWQKKVWDRMRWVRDHEGWYWEPLLQIHDDLLTEYQEDKQAEVERHMADALDDLQLFPIPITSEASAGQRWSDL